ncbi:MAG: GntR family transcriptional regulator [Bacteroidota bacterium]
MTILRVPVYQKLVAFYKQKINNQELPPNSKMDSIVRIMKRHNVSRDTAKRVQKELSEEGYIRKIIGKGTFVTSSTKVKKIWGMVIPFYSSNIEELIHNLKIEANQTGNELIYFLTYNNPDEEKRLVAEMVMKGYEAVIVIPNYNETITAGFYQRLIPGNTTIVLVDNTMAGSYFKYVIQSYDLGVARALEYLTTQNNGNLLFVKNEDWQGRNLLYELMDKTFSSIVQAKHEPRISFSLQNARELTYKFLIQNNIGGILCCTDIDSVRVLGRIKNWGIKIRHEISLVSYGNTELTEYFNPPITSLDCQYSKMAAKTAELIQKGKKSGLFEQHIIHPKIIIRET